MLDPSLGRFRDSHYVPSDVEINRIQEMIPPDEQELARLDEEIAKAKAIVGQLQDKRKGVEMNLSIRKASISPIRRLPPEILSQIYLLTLPETRYVKPDIHKSPLILRRICKAWQSIADLTPNLWFSINLQFKTSAETTPNFSPARIAEWLIRSAHHPIAIKFLFRAGHRGNTPYMHKLVDTLVPFAQRWKFVALSAPISAMQRLLGGHESSLPMLESLELCPDDGLRDGDNLSITESATTLRELILHKESRFLTLPWQQVTSLVMLSGIHNMTIAGCLALIRLLPRLEYSFFKMTLIGEIEPPGQTVHPELRELEITGSSRLSLALLDHLTLPALRYLTINFKYTQGEGWFRRILPQLTSFISRSSCPIEDIQFPNQTPDLEEPDSSIDFVEQFPSLLKLRITRKSGGMNCLSSRARTLLAERRSRCGMRG
jgi:hypothetical protein